jgi:DMSO/TMAO reductase YedYZ molybdopterin-dependent catalytic subunit
LRSTYLLTVDGEVERPLRLTLADIVALPFVERVVRIDCAGGPRDDATMRGPTIEHLMDLAGTREGACLAVFHCADGHRERIPLVDLILCGAFLVYAVDGEPAGEPEQPVRLAIPGKFGHLWAKWVQRVELQADAEVQGVLGGGARRGLGL